MWESKCRIKLTHVFRHQYWGNEWDKLIQDFGSVILKSAIDGTQIYYLVRI